MKLQTLFPILSLLLFSFNFIQAKIMLLYKFRTHEARRVFDDSDGQECVQKAIKVKSCGMDHLQRDESAYRAAYEKCVKALNFPADFEAEALALQPSDFTSPSVFEDAYNRKLVNYAKKIDGMFEGPAKPTKLEFSFNWIALLLIPLAFGIIYFINKPKNTGAADNSNEKVSQV
jgi:hypothetical protein